MTMQIQFFGAAGEVTGSCHLLQDPLAIEATQAYAGNSELFDDESLQLWRGRERR